MIVSLKNKRIFMEKYDWQMIYTVGFLKEHPPTHPKSHIVELRDKTEEEALQSFLKTLKEVVRELKGSEPVNLFMITRTPDEPGLLWRLRWMYAAEFAGTPGNQRLLRVKNPQRAFVKGVGGVAWKQVRPPGFGKTSSIRVS
jgi:hypothetical protein